jgi:hypothetical protein
MCGYVYRYMYICIFVNTLYIIYIFKYIYIGKKEIAMIAQARAKKETEMCLPPFTDEASLVLRRCTRHDMFIYVYI